MKIELTKRGDYAMRAMLALAQAGDESLTAHQIAERTSVPPSFLPQVMATLSRAELVHGRIGRIGGYRLGRPPSEISILEVIETVEGDSRRTTCVLRNSPCAEDGYCIAHEAFYGAQEELRDALRRASLASVVYGLRGSGTARGAGRPAHGKGPKGTVR